MVDFMINNYEVPFYVREAVDTLKDFLCIYEDTNTIIAKAKKIGEEGEPVNEELVDLILQEVIDGMPAVLNAMNTSDSSYIVEKSLIVLLNSLGKEELDRVEKLIDIDNMVRTIEDKLMISFPYSTSTKILKLVEGKFPKYDVTNIEVPIYTEAAISGLTAMERSIKTAYPNINQNVLNSLLREIGSGVKDVDSFGEVVNEEGDIDEAPILKNKKAVRNGKVVTLKKRKKRMSAAQRRKISRAMKKVKKIIKPSTIRKMLKSRRLAQKRGL